MSVLKASNVTSEPRVFQMRDVEHQAAGLVELARKQAANVLTRADAEAERMREDARGEGFDEGRREGLEAGRREGLEEGRQAAYSEHATQLTHLVQTLSAALVEIETHRQALADEAAAAIARLSVALAEKVTKRKGFLDPGVLERNVAAAARLATDSHDVRLVVHPSQVEQLIEVVDELKLQWPALAHATVVEDDGIAPGGVRLQAVGCEVDATLETQLEKLAAELLPE